MDGIRVPSDEIGAAGFDDGSALSCREEHKGDPLTGDVAPMPQNTLFDAIVRHCEHDITFYTERRDAAQREYEALRELDNRHMERAYAWSDVRYYDAKICSAAEVLITARKLTVCPCGPCLRSRAKAQAEAERCEEIGGQR